MNIIFVINGGMGKVIAATAVCASFKAKYPEAKLITISGYPEVFLGNPNVERAFAYGQMAYFYRDFIENQEALLFAHDPYMETAHAFKREEHLIETWCKLYDLPVTKKTGELFITSREKDAFSKKFSSDKPILLMQTNGGATNDLKYSWARDIPSYVVAAVVEEFKDEYNIVHIRRDDQIQYEGTFGVQDSLRSLVVLISMSTKRLFMDSFAQHAAAALNMPSTVLWICNYPNVFGYSLHDNIVSNPETAKPELRNAFLSKYNIGGELMEFCYNDEKDIFDVEKVIASIRKDESENKVTF